MAWISNYINIKLCELITHSCFNFNDGLAELLLKLRYMDNQLDHTKNTGCNYLTMPLPWIKILAKEALQEQQTLGREYSDTLLGLRKKKCNSIADKLKLP